MNRVSVCMATYNGARFIRQQIDTILPQLTNTDEVIFSDDGSTDETISIIQSYHDSRFIIINGPRSGSPAQTFERGLAHCSGDFIFLTDQDDLWRPSKVALIKEHLSTHDLVLSDCSIINNQNDILVESFFSKQKSKKGLINNLIRNSYMGCCMAFNRKVLDHILPFPSHMHIHDQWIGLIAEKYCQVYFLHEPLVYYRRHGSNYSVTGEKSHFNFFEKLKHRTNMILAVYNR